MEESVHFNNAEPAARRVAKGDLIFINSLDDGISRQKHGRGFTYRWPSGQTVSDQETRQRINSLVIPPAWNEVLICSQPNGHLQAVGIDDAGRRQYIYHQRWKAVSAAAKFDRMHLMGKLLPKIRRRVLRDLKQRRFVVRLCPSRIARGTSLSTSAGIFPHNQPLGVSPRFMGTGR